MIKKTQGDLNEIEKIDKTQFSNLIEIHQLSMYRLAKSILLNEHDSEDAVGSAIYKAYVSRNTIRDVNSFKSWILKIVSNESYSILRNKKKVICMEQVVEKTQDIGDYESSYEIWDSIQRLGRNYRAVIILYYYEDFSIKSISETLNINQSTAKVRLFRGRQQLKADLLNKGGLINE